jgi:hypothetical protein
MFNTQGIAMQDEWQCVRNNNANKGSAKGIMQRGAQEEQCEEQHHRNNARKAAQGVTTWKTMEEECEKKIRLKKLDSNKCNTK